MWIPAAIANLRWLLFPFLSHNLYVTRTPAFERRRKGARVFPIGQLSSKRGSDWAKVFRSQPTVYTVMTVTFQPKEAFGRRQPRLARDSTFSSAVLSFSTGIHCVNECDGRFHFFDAGMGTTVTTACSEKSIAGKRVVLSILLTNQVLQATRGCRVDEEASLDLTTGQEPRLGSDR